jgi:putative transposase
MKSDPHIHQRRSIRLQAYDYTQPGAYFITLVTYQRECLFGEFRNGEMECSILGEIAREEWKRSIGIRKEIRLHENELVIMPNHIHAIVWLIEVGADGVCPKEDEGAAIMGARHAPQPVIRASKSLGAFIAGYKASVTSRAGKELNMTGIWQRNYYEHIIRNEAEHNPTHPHPKPLLCECRTPRKFLLDGTQPCRYNDWTLNSK